MISLCSSTTFKKTFDHLVVTSKVWSCVCKPSDLMCACLRYWAWYLEGRSIHCNGNHVVVMLVLTLQNVYETCSVEFAMRRCETCKCNRLMWHREIRTSRFVNSSRRFGSMQTGIWNLRCQDEFQITNSCCWSLRWLYMIIVWINDRL